MTALEVAPEASILIMHAHGLPFEGKLRAARVLEKELTPFLAAARKEVFENLHDLTDTAGPAPHAVRLLVCHGEVLHQILEQEETRHCDLIVIGRDGEAPLMKRVFLGSVTKEVLALSRVDVLVTPAQ
jgi:nucleotide-binding universal stress UspA family protein